MTTVNQTSPLESYLQSLTRFGIRPGLSRIKALLKEMHLDIPPYPCILIGGTNGKGSTSEFLARALAADGLKTGLYTSPHLYHYNERLRILPANDKQLFAGAISDADATAILSEALPVLHKIAAEMNDPTEFETLTLLAILYFARQKVDVAVLEVGLGGRYDCTNAIDPLVSAVTHVDLDHCDRLGDTREKIAFDKVHIARPEHILISAETRPEVLKVLSDYSNHHKVLFRPWRAPQWNTDANWDISSVTDIVVHKDDFQSINYQTAMQTRQAFYESNHQAVPRATQTKPQFSVPGRYEILQQYPLLVVDGANNPDGARHLAARLQKDLSRSSDRKLILVLGILADKDYKQMIDILAPLASVVIATESQSPRRAPAEEVATHAAQLGITTRIIRPVTAAVQQALKMASTNDIVAVTGSFYTLGEIDRAVLL